ncbi:MAG: ComEC/Rec2 family competence protein [bacterium]
MSTRHPLVGVTVCLMAGTWCGLTQEVQASAVFVAAWLCLLLALLALRSPRRPACDSTDAAPWIQPLHVSALRQLPLFATLVLTGWAAAAARIEESRSCTLTGLCGADGATVEMEGVITDDPAMLGSALTNRTLWQFTLQPSFVRSASNAPAMPARNPVVIRLPVWNDRKPPAYGEGWRIAGRLRQDGTDRIVPSRRFHLSADGMRSTRLSAGNGNPLAGWCYGQRRVVANYLATGIGDFPGHVGLLRALILGYRQDLPPDVRDDFAWTGTLHIIAISGSHVVVVAGILIFVLQAFGISRMHWGLFLAPLLAGYTVAIGIPASAARAALMAVIYFSAPLLRRKADVLSSLALAALIILGVAPAQLFDLGFILSFVCVLGLIILCPLINDPLMKLLEPDPLRLQPEERWITAARSVGRYCVSLLVLAVAGWLVSTPLSAYYFGRFSIVALPANLIIIPMAFLILVAGCLSIALGPCLLLFADIFNHANLALVTLMLRSMDLLARIPGGSIECKWPLWAMLLWYLILAIAAIWLHSRQLERREKPLPATS